MSYRKQGFWVFVLAACFVTPESANAEVRWQADGNACSVPEYQFGPDYDSFALKLGIYAESATCAIPIGPSLVDLGDGTHLLRQVDVRLKQDEGDTTIRSRIYVHDYDSASFCSCGSKTDDLSEGQNKLQSLTFDCLSCSYESSWAANVAIRRTGDTYGYTIIRMVNAHD